MLQDVLHHIADVAKSVRFFRLALFPEQKVGREPFRILMLEMTLTGLAETDMLAKSDGD